MQRGQDIEWKLTENQKELQEQKTSITEAQACIAELEDYDTEMLTKQTHQMQDKLADLEARSSRNNIQIFGLPEDIEGSAITVYLDRLLKKELELPEGTSLQIQRVYRALALKPGLGGAPRAVVVNFLRFETKEMVLQKVWQKKGIQVINKKIQLDHDYPTEIFQKCKTYLGIKKNTEREGDPFSDPIYENKNPLEQRC